MTLERIDDTKVVTREEYMCIHLRRVAVSFTNKTDRHGITEILLKVALAIINKTNKRSHDDRVI
jgi:hypothetical protein